jgi:hypothetical protein
MSRDHHLTAFARLATDSLPNIHQLDETRQVFWILSAAKFDPSISVLTAAQVAEIGCDLCNISLSRQRVLAIAAQAKAAGQVTSIRRNKKSYFKIVKRGEDELLGGGDDGALFVDPAKALTSIRAVERIMEGLEGDVRICDPYVDSKTLDYIARSTKTESIKLLTENVQDSSRLRRDLSAFRREHTKSIEIRVSPAGELHDRYILFKDGMFWIGASLKDIAKKQSMIVNLSAHLAGEVSRTFDRCWGRSSKFE